MHPIIDCHCHIYPDKIAQKAGQSISEFYDIPVDNDSTVAEMMEAEKSAGVTHAIVFSVATKVSQVESINRFIAGETAKSNGFMTGLGTLHPDSPDIEGDVNLLLELGLKGVKLHPDFQRFKLDDYRCLKIFEVCEKNHLPVLIHTGDYRYDFSNPNRLKPILDIYEDIVIIGAHFGGWSIWEQATEILHGYKNFYVDCSSSMYALSSDAVLKIIRTYGAERVLFGSDYPMWHPSDELKRLNSVGLTQHEKELILYKNARDLFKINI